MYAIVLEVHRCLGSRWIWNLAGHCLSLIDLNAAYCRVYLCVCVCVRACVHACVRVCACLGQGQEQLYFSRSLYIPYTACCTDYRSTGSLHSTLCHQHTPNVAIYSPGLRAAITVAMMANTRTLVWRTIILDILRASLSQHLPLQQYVNAFIITCIYNYTSPTIRHAFSLF